MGPMKCDACQAEIERDSTRPTTFDFTLCDGCLSAVERLVCDFVSKKSAACETVAEAAKRGFRS